MIQFQSPALLPALLLIAIPVIIHLFNFRRFKKIVFTNVRFLKELKQETTSKSKLKHLLILCARILAVAFLVFAFARPVLPVEGRIKTTDVPAVSIYIDNSFTMEAVRSDGTLLESASRKAREIASAYPPSTRFQLLTSDFDPVHQRLLSREEFIDMSQQVKTGSGSRTISEILKRQKEALLRSNSTSEVHYIISDFQANMAGGELTTDTASDIIFVPVQAESGSNIYIDSVWFSSPAVQVNQPAELMIKINSVGNEEASVPVRLLINGQVRAVTTVNPVQGKPLVTAVNFTITEAGWHKAEISINDHPVTFDDVYYFSFEVKDKIQVMALNGHGQSPYLKALFGNNSFVSFTNTEYTQVDYRSLPMHNLVVLNELPVISSGLAEELEKYIYGGGHVICFPDSNADLVSYNSFFRQVNADAFAAVNNNSDKVTTVDRTNALFEDVFQQNSRQEGAIDYPVATKHFDLMQASATNRQILMRLQGGGPFLSQYDAGKGSLYVFTVPLTPGFSNLARHAVFVPALYKMALLSLKGHQLAFTIGRDLLQLKGNIVLADDNFSLINEKKEEMIPRHRVSTSGIDITFENVTTAGHYDLMSGNTLVSALSFNYSRKESDMRFLTADMISNLMAENNIRTFKTIDARTGDLSKTLRQLNEGISLWKYCILLVLLFLLAETLLLRFWKT